jgi:integrase
VERARVTGPGVQNQGLQAEATITIDEWLHDNSLRQGSLLNRRTVVRLIEKTNHSRFDQIVSNIESGARNPYSTSRAFLDVIRETHSPYVVYLYRSMLPGMWESILGESNFSRRVFDRLVPAGSAYVVEVKQVPERAKVVEMLRMASPQSRALVGVLAVSGMRIREALTRKWSDLEIRERGYARVNLKAGETKAGYSRHTFVTKECLEWLGSRRQRQSEYLFPGENGGPLSYNPAHAAVKPLFARVGLLDKPDRSEVYTPHSFRTFAGDQMRDCGLQEKYVLAIIGHRALMGSEASYLDWRKIEEKWAETCADKLCFFDNSATVKAENQALKNTNGKLEALMEKLLERLT